MGIGLFPGRSKGPFLAGPSRVSSAAWTPASLGSNLKGWWKSDAGVRGRTAAYFTSANSEDLSRADEAVLKVTTKMSVAFWLKMAVGNTNRGIVGSWQTTNRWTVSTEGSGKPRLYFDSVSNYGESDAAISVGAWTHVVAVYDGGGATDADKVQIYLNGTLRTLTFAGTIPTTISTAGTPAFRVASIGAAYMDGTMGNLALFGRALSSADVTALYNGGSGVRYADNAVSYTSLIGWWELDENSGTRADKTANALTLTDNNTVTANDGKVDYAAADGDAVWKWQDQSATGLLPVQTTHANKPLLKTAVHNSRDCVRFDGTNDVLQVAAGAVASQPFQMWIVAKQIAGAGGSHYYFDAGGASETVIGEGTAGKFSAYAGAFVEGVHTFGALHLYSGVFDGASSKAIVDGTEVATGNASTNNMTGVTLGGQSVGAGWANIDACEALVTTVLTGADLTNMKSYIATRWGLTIA